MRQLAGLLGGGDYYFLLDRLLGGGYHVFLLNGDHSALLLL